MEHDAWMEIGNNLNITVDDNSTKYKSKLGPEIIESNNSMFTYMAKDNSIDAVSSATEKYYANRGLVHIYKNGKVVDLAHLHIMEWLDAIRFGKKN